MAIKNIFKYNRLFLNLPKNVSCNSFIWIRLSVYILLNVFQFYKISKLD